MRTFFVHGRFGAPAGSKTGGLTAAREQKRHAHLAGILQGPCPRRGASPGKVCWKRLSLIITPRVTFLRQVGASKTSDFTAQMSLEVQYIESKTHWGGVKILRQPGSEKLSEKGSVGI